MSSVEESGISNPAVPVAARKRPRPGERRVQILQALATMLQQPGAERITTAALAARLEVSEAALYRHFASKAQMFEGLIEFIESSVFTLINRITEPHGEGETPVNGTDQAMRIVTMVLQFAERNPGMVKVMVGDALVFENERLQQRMNLFFDKIEASLRQCLRGGADAASAAAPTAEAQRRAALLGDLLRGRLLRYVRSGFKSTPAADVQNLLEAMR
ncbi:nucleoid occlusion factor SlmA [Diaphorobacter aerolatus]|uniref:Nucleoid occlusion factor SlmA n=1 Tax=Diaphorobacter aerolatus TaxID=1288495 RepID=A0A7H0GNT3_9BURK|nr:nucleoid occlusion factor SlmA [Diaphorobacter aerolatus]QNP49949.1 nucleoid occlusion factor SlmA [Diaphorobacter aerolatus]